MMFLDPGTEGLAARHVGHEEHGGHHQEGSSYVRCRINVLQSQPLWRRPHAV